MSTKDLSPLEPSDDVGYGQTNGSAPFESYRLSKAHEYEEPEYEHENGYHRQEEQQNLDNTTLDSPLGDSSRSSSNATLGSGSDDTPTHQEKRKSKPKLRIVSRLKSWF